MHTFKQKMNSGKYKVHMDTLSSTKWTKSIAGVWTPSPYWSNPKPIGTYYLPVIAILTPAIVLLTLGAKGILKRFLQLAIVLANFILVIGVTCLVDSLPVSGEFCSLKLTLNACTK